MLRILTPYEGEHVLGTPCRTCGDSHPHNHELIVVEALPIGTPIAIPIERDPYAISPEIEPPRRRR